MSARDAKSHALTHVGARPADRTSQDDRILKQVREIDTESKYIDSQSEVGGYPNLAENTRTLTIPDNGRAEWLYEFTKEVEVGVHTYADDSGTVTNTKLQQALSDWKGDAIDTPLLRRVINAW